MPILTIEERHALEGLLAGYVGDGAAALRALLQRDEAERVAEVGDCAAPPRATARVPSGIGGVIVRALDEAIRQIYTWSGRKPGGIKMLVDPDVFREAAASSATVRKGLPIYRANGEACVDLMTCIGPITLTEWTPPIHWRGGRF